MHISALTPLTDAQADEQAKTHFQSLQTKLGMVPTYTVRWASVTSGASPDSVRQSRIPPDTTGAVRDDRRHHGWATPGDMTSRLPCTVTGRSRHVCSPLLLPLTTPWSEHRVLWLPSTWPCAAALPPRNPAGRDVGGRARPLATPAKGLTPVDMAVAGWLARRLG